MAFNRHLIRLMMSFYIICVGCDLDHFECWYRTLRTDCANWRFEGICDNVTFPSANIDWLCTRAASADSVSIY